MKVGKISNNKTSNDQNDKSGTLTNHNNTHHSQMSNSKSSVQNVSNLQAQKSYQSDLNYAVHPPPSRKASNASNLRMTGGVVSSSRNLNDSQRDVGSIQRFKTQLEDPQAVIEKESEHKEGIEEYDEESEDFFKNFYTIEQVD